VSALGHDAATSCAAYRAGLSAASPLHGQFALNEEQNDFEAIVGHQIPVVLSGFEGIGRLICIGWYALQDLACAYMRGIDLERAGFYIALPLAWDRLKESSAQESGETGSHRDDSTVAARSRHESNGLELQLCRRLTELAQLRIPQQNWRTFKTGHAGFAVALASAAQALRAQKLSYCIVAGLDSLVDTTALQWLGDQELVKAPGNPLGLQPGEAGAVVCVETYATAQQRNADVLAEVAAVALGHEPAHFLSGKQCLGKGLADTLWQLLGTLPTLGKGRPWIIADQTGESHRAAEWGHALLRLVALKREFADSVTSFPAASFGDTGAASGGISTCTAVGAFMRHYATNDSVIVTSSSLAGERAAACIMNAST